ncbi:MAG: hypothetical protein AAFV87_12300, partial [Pseudomonadota bacterium]
MTRKTTPTQARQPRRRIKCFLLIDDPNEVHRIKQPVWRAHPNINPRAGRRDKTAKATPSPKSRKELAQKSVALPGLPHLRLPGQRIFHNPRHKRVGWFRAAFGQAIEQCLDLGLGWCRFSSHRYILTPPSAGPR